MSKEINLLVNLAVKNGNLQSQINPPNQVIDQSTQALSDQTQTIPTSWTAINIAAEVASYGVGCFRNLDVTNYVQIGIFASTGNIKPFAKVKAGECYPLRLDPSAIYYAKANTASIKLRTMVAAD
jgi:hypothetical protein